MSALRALDLPPVWAALAGAASWGLARLAPAPGLEPPLWTAALPAVLGVALAAWAALGFLRRRTPIEPRREPRALLADGPYRINRNPIYTGITLVLLGWALHLGAFAALLPVAAYPVLIDRRFVRAEEAALRRAFGPEAEAYFARTRRW